MQQISEFDAKGEALSTEVQQKISELDPRLAEQTMEEENAEDTAPGKVRMTVTQQRTIVLE